MGWLKAVGRAVKWVVTNETVRNVALSVVADIIQKKAAEKSGAEGK